MQSNRMETIATIADLDAFDISQLTFAPLKKPEGGVSTGPSARPSRAHLRYKGQGLRIQTPMMHLPFKYEGDISTLTFSTRADSATKEEKEYVNAFNRVMLLIQAEAHNIAKKNSQEWFGKSETAFGESSENFTYALREHPEGKYPPQMKIKYFKGDNGNPQFDIYDGNTHDEIHTRSKGGSVDFGVLFAQGTRHVVVMECMGIWCLNKRGGITWRMNDVLSYGVAPNRFPFSNVQATVAASMDVADETMHEDDLNGEYTEAPHL